MGIIYYGQPGVAYGAGFTYGQNVSSVPQQLIKKMKQAALKLDEKNLDQCMDLGQEMEEGLKNKPAFAAVAPTPAAMKLQRDAIVLQRGVLAGAVGAVALQQGALDGLESTYRNSLTLQAGSAIQLVNGDEAQLAGTNIPLRQAGTPATDAPPPLENPHGSYGDLSGEVDWAWNGPPRRMLFIAEIATSAAGPFTFAYSGNKSGFTSKGHPPGTEIFMRSKCSCNGFDSDWSQVVSHRAR
ncbi:MAG TPA: hypothetical protein VI454_07585 [Verrucomicrobiae bacterium]|jgi:hypothetical protein